MFTGIIEATAPILEKTSSSLAVGRPPSFTDVHRGSSISVSGACLSVTKLTEQAMSFDVVPETLAKTKFGSLKVGDHVNLERALRADGRFDGHVVQGHVEGVASVISNVNGTLTIQLPEELVRFVIPKGSIALDGVSLTVASVDGSRCSVALIPLTQDKTTLRFLQVYDTVNVETDVFVRALHAEEIPHC